MKKIISKIICFIFGHIINEGEYIDNHGNDDALSFCERCGQYDV